MSWFNPFNDRLQALRDQIDTLLKENDSLRAKIHSIETDNATLRRVYDDAINTYDKNINMMRNEINDLRRRKK